MVKNIKEEDSGINIYIGSENEFDDAYREMILMARAFYEVQGHEGQDQGTE